MSHQIFHISNYRQQFQDAYKGHHDKFEYSRWVTMTALGMMAIQLRIADFKFAHNFIICKGLPDMEILFGVIIQENFPCQMPGIRKRTVTYRRMVDFSPTPETVNRRQLLGLSSQLLKYHPDTMALFQPRSKDIQLKDIWHTLSVIKIQQIGKIPK